MSVDRAADLASRTSYGVSFGSILAGLTLNEWAAVVGIIATILTVLVNWYYKVKQFRVEVAKARAAGAKIDE